METRHRKDQSPMTDEVPTTDITALLEKWYPRVPQIGGEFVTVEALVDAVYNTLDPGLTAPVEIQRLALQKLDELAMKFCQKRYDGHYYKIFDNEAFDWTGSGQKVSLSPIPYGPTQRARK